MTLPFYQPSASTKHPCSLHQHGNAGLWFTRFYHSFDQDWEVDEKGKLAWLQTVQGPRGDKLSLENAAKRLDSLGKALGAEIQDFKTDWHFATGLGLKHPIENGFTWHHTLGVPYLPSSSVKGLLRGWVEAWMEHENEQAKQERISLWFGSTSNEENSDVGAGNLIFFDALPIGVVTLGSDVMTPHMGEWYAKGGEINSEADYAKRAPADWHNPLPVPFLVVKKAEFKFMIAPRLTGNSAQDTLSRMAAKAAMVELTQALEWIGAGAKTAAGYGRMQAVGAEQAAKLAQSQQGIEKANGIIWGQAKATWDKGKGMLNVQSSTDKATLVGASAKLIFDSLSEQAQKRLKDGKKPLLVNATVDQHGNLFTLLSIEEISAS